MSNGETQDQGFNRIVEQLCSIDGVECETLADGRLRLEISHSGAKKEVFLAVSASDYRLQKIQYAQLAEALIELGIEEGLTFVTPPLPRRPMTPPMRAAREKQKQEFEAWQEVWRSLRQAEKALDVAYEIVQMQAYY